MGRIADRSGMADETRLRLLEGDMDSIEAKVDAHRMETKVEFDAMSDRFDGLTKLLISILVAIVVSAIGLAINILVAVAR